MAKLCDAANSMQRSAGRQASCGHAAEVCSNACLRKGGGGHLDPALVRRVDLQIMPVRGVQAQQAAARGAVSRVHDRPEVPPELLGLRFAGAGERSRAVRQHLQRANGHGMQAPAEAQMFAAHENVHKTDGKDGLVPVEVCNDMGVHGFWTSRHTCARPACVRTPPCLRMSSASTMRGASLLPSSRGAQRSVFSCTFRLMPANWPPCSNTVWGRNRVPS